jgi:non-ribosomal peptide synthetase component F
MTGASMFWLDTLHDCNLDQSLSLPYDRYRLSDQNRTGRGTSLSFDFGEHLSRAFFSFTSLNNNTTLPNLALTCFYAFLFKLTNGDDDLCIGMNTDGRYRDELKSVIGMFVNAIPLRCQLNPHWSFHQLLDYVQEMKTNCMKYSYFPLQLILAQHPNTSHPAFLDRSFEFHFIRNENRKNEIEIGDSRICRIPTAIKISGDEIKTKFDFVFFIEHNLDVNQFSCTINASTDLFDTKTIVKIAQRFHSMLHQLFGSIDSRTKRPIYEISLSLPDERLLIQSMNHTEISVSSVTCTHYAFVSQVRKYPQKLAVELDEQSLTYIELLYYAQRLSLKLFNECNIKPGDAVCQCVERSLSMVNIFRTYFL